MYFLYVPILVTSPLRILLQHTTLCPPYLLHHPFIITRFCSLLNYHPHLSPYKILLYRAFQFHHIRLLGYLLIPSCIPLDLSCNHGLVVLLNTDSLYHYLASHFYSMSTAHFTTLQIYFITCIVSIIIVLVDLLLSLVSDIVLIVLLVSFLVTNHVITVLTLILSTLTKTFIVSLTLPHIMFQDRILNSKQTLLRLWYTTA